MRDIEIYGKHFFAFYESKEDKVRRKIDFVLKLVSTEAWVPSKFLRPIVNRPSLYEVRIQCDTNQYRIFCFFESTNKLILLNLIHKKTQKTPKQALDLAQQLKREYYENQ